MAKYFVVNPPPGLFAKLTPAAGTALNTKVTYRINGVSKEDAKRAKWFMFFSE